jgi:phenylacetate-coenzyme A ligase PaaK-like adenylate-forming protein
MVKYLCTFQPNTLFGLPSTLTSLLNYCLENKVNLHIEKIFYAGEHMPPAMVDHFQKHWGVTGVHSAGYASADAGIIGYQCACQSGGEHHVFSDLVILELLSEEGKIIQNPGEEGEIVVTSLYRKYMPIVRYRTGDLGSYSDRPCACGRQDRVFHMIGRCDDRLQIGGARIFVQDLDKLLHKYEMLTGIYQFVPQYREQSEFLQVCIECRGGQEFPSRLVAEFQKEFYQIFSDLSLSISQEWIAEAEILFVPECTIPRVPRTQKVKLIDDRRRN